MCQTSLKNFKSHRHVRRVGMEDVHIPTRNNSIFIHSQYTVRPPLLRVPAWLESWFILERNDGLFYSTCCAQANSRARAGVNSCLFWTNGNGRLGANRTHQQASRLVIITSQKIIKLSKWFLTTAPGQACSHKSHQPSSLCFVGRCNTVWLGII